MHPDVTGVEVTAEGLDEVLPMHTVDSAGYVLFEISEGLGSYTAELLIGDTPVPGTREEKQVPTP